MHLSPDGIIYWQWGPIQLNATLVGTWVLMLVLVAVAKLITRNLQHGPTQAPRSRWQNGLEIIVITINQQISDVGLSNPRRYLPFIGTLFLFVAVSALSSIVPGFEPPTGSLSRTAALALCVFVAVPAYGIATQGLGNYLKTYLNPTPIMLPFNLVGEVSRTLALAVRLFGNMMSGAMILGILLSLTPLLFPVVMTLLGLLTGMVQAYIFSILVTVYIAAAVVATEKTNPQN